MVVSYRRALSYSGEAQPLGVVAAWGRRSPRPGPSDVVRDINDMFDWPRLTIKILVNKMV